MPQQSLDDVVDSRTDSMHVSTPPSDHNRIEQSSNAATTTDIAPVTMERTPSTPRRSAAAAAQLAVTLAYNRTPKRRIAAGLATQEEMEEYLARRGHRNKMTQSSGDTSDSNNSNNSNNNTSMLTPNNHTNGDDNGDTDDNGDIESVDMDISNGITASPSSHRANRTSSVRQNKLRTPRSATRSKLNRTSSSSTSKSLLEKLKASRLSTPTNKRRSSNVGGHDLANLGKDVFSGKRQYSLTSKHQLLTDKQTMMIMRNITKLKINNLPRKLKRRRRVNQNLAHINNNNNSSSNSNITKLITNL
ncbi:hypothetical protein BDF22DRAFT_97066 [Syncephalis plumigaleata]|nr:hypothetical protein BDF22DRAFT_97066 [Syncephalis plumigaleata]